MKSLLYLVTIFLFLHVLVTASPLIRDSCKKAAEEDEKLKLKFCVESLEGNPHSKTAKKLPELTMASLENSLTKAKSLKAKIKKDLDERKYPKKSDVPIRECLEFYQYEVESLESASRETKKHNYTEAISHINDGFQSVDACETQFKVTPMDSPFTKDNDVMTQLLRIPYAFAKMLNSSTIH